MRKTLLNVTAAAALLAVTTVSQAGTLANSGGSAVIYTFGAPGPIHWVAGQVENLAGAGGTAVFGVLTGVTVSATLIDNPVAPGSDTAQANDLMLLVQDIGSVFQLQIGGTDPLPYSTLQQHAWANGNSAALNTPVSGFVAVTNTHPFLFGDPITGLTLLVGNGSAADNGTWTGSITLHGLQLAPVPEPATWAMFAAGAAGLVGWMGRRRKAAVTA